MKTCFAARIAGLFILLTACDSIETFPASDAGGSDASTSTDSSTSVDAAPSPCAGKDCDDKNECTTDKCDETTSKCINDKQPNGVLCSDGNLCTEGDMCANGQCSGTAKDCEDGDKCTINGCDAKTGKCASQDKTGCVPDEPCDAANCDDSNPCTDDLCGAADLCIHVNDDGNTCVDGNKCTTSDACKAGICAGSAKSCNDNNACTTDACDPKTGECVYTPVSNQWKEPCNDSSDATVNDTCVDGKCVGEVPAPKCAAANCDDGNKCTTDYCSAAGICAHATTSADGAICAPATASADYKCEAGLCKAFLKPECTYNTDCGDKNPCMDDYCVAGKCKWVAKVCNDGNSCTMDSCDPAQGCVFTAIPGCGQPPPECSFNSHCNDNNPCTSDSCSNGACVFKPIPGCGVDPCAGKVCNDNNNCTTDTCDPSKGCVFTNVNDGVFCAGNTDTTTYKCEAGMCKAFPQAECFNNTFCNDNNACTFNLCEAGKCKYLPQAGLACNDNNACTVNDACTAGAFCSGTPKSCDDGNVCTADSCSTSGQCVNSVIAGCGVDPCAGKVCNDNNPCTADTCSAGTCSFTPIPGCGAQGAATSLTITWTNDAGAQISFNKKGVDTLNLWVECKQSANEFLNETEQIPWFVYATSAVNAVSLSKNFSTKALTECKVNVQGTKQGQSVIWAARGGDQDFPNGKAIQGSVSYTWNGITVTNVDHSSNGQGGYDWKFSPGGDSDGDGINDLQDPFKYDGSK